MGFNSLSDLSRRDLLQNKGFVNGQWVTAIDGKTFDVINPATLEPLATLPEMGANDTQKAIESAHECFGSFKQTAARERARWLRRWHQLCLEHIDDLALILTLENGKTLAEARAEVLYGASFLEWFAGEAERTYGQVIPAANTGQRILTIQQPLGVAALLTPWNFPIAMITRKAGAALAAGCTTVWKPAGETPLSCIAQAVLAQDAGFPPGSINVVLTLDKIAEVGEAFCKSQKVQKISFTGSTRVGKLLAEKCGQTLKKLSLELGGNSPFIVFDDADLDRAAEILMLAKFRNSGQTCVTANRVFVQKGIYDKFAMKMRERMQQLKVGPGIQADVNVGPLTHQGGLRKALSHIEDAQRLGGEVILGGSLLPELGGHFMQPTLITNMKQDMITTREEVFAPVLGLYQFEDEREAITLANDSNVGLGSFVVTESISRSWRVAEALNTGMVGINVGSLSACESPFGGVKESGYGREGGAVGLSEYMTVKSILVGIS